MAVILTDAAAEKVRALLEREETPGLVLRVAVQPGGCSGLRYALYFDEARDSDIVSEGRDVRVAVDRMSAPYLNGTRIDYVDGIQQSGFVIDNPNAQSTCACGDSFH